MTSSDVLDTCLTVQLVRAADLLIADVDRLLAALKTRAFEHKRHAHHRPQPRHPRRADHLRPEARRLYAEFAARQARLAQAAREEVATCAISGAVGTFANVDPRGRGLRRRQARPAPRAGLDPGDPARPPRRVLRHARASVASSIERLAIEIRHLQRTEVREAEEYFSPGQKGSSAMPHKRNPVLTENLTGLARLVRGYGAAGAGERGALARARHLPLLGRARHRPRRHRHARLRPARLAGVIEKLVVYPENMRANLDRLGGLVHSAARAAGADPEGRQPRGRLPPRPAQRHAGLAQGDGDFLALLKADPEVTGARRQASSRPCSTSATTSSTSTRSSPACSATA